ncbi:MAG: hypothetical protein R2836_07040 [Chitinophagales bacterium]
MLALIFVNGQNCKNIELVYKKGIAYSDTTNKYSGRYIEYYPGKQKMRETIKWTKRWTFYLFLLGWFNSKRRKIWQKE